MFDVRTPTGQPFRNGVLVNDLPNVVIRGLSAAVVVFLAVEGGLAIFTTSKKPEPNPYVLLFTCLVAAVYSGDVWAWARVRLRDSFSGDHKDSAKSKVTSASSDKSGPADGSE